MTKREYRRTRIGVLIGLAWVALCVAALGWVGSAEASSATWHHVKLNATGKQQTWRSPQVGLDTQALSWAVYIDGREVTHSHEWTGGNPKDGECRAGLQTRRLALEIESCGTAPATIRYLGSTRFTFAYRF